MYQLIAAKKKMPMSGYDYVFDNIKAFYNICDLLTVPLVGRYHVAIKEDQIDSINEFLSVESKYSAMLIDLICPDNIIDYLTMVKGDITTKGGSNSFDQYKELVKEKSLLFEDKKLISLLYASIPHDYEEMDKILGELRNEYGTKMITKEMLSKAVILNNVVYPRQVLMAFLTMDRYRHSKLKKCIESMGNDIVLFAMRKNVISLLEQKQAYYKTGKTNWMLQQIDTKNLLLMYRALVVERNGLKDVTILLDLYERGVSSYDIVFGEQNKLY